MNDVTTTNAMVRGKHLTAFHDHLDHMLVTHILGRKNGIAVKYEDVHRETLHQVSVVVKQIVFYSIVTPDDISLYNNVKPRESRPPVTPAFMQAYKSSNSDVLAMPVQ